MDLSIIIVSYNTKKLLSDCLSSIFNSHTKFSYEIIVIDNHSTDGSPAMIKKNFPQIKLIQNDDNRGFGAANNQGAHQAQGDFLFFLNSDTLLKPDTIQKLLHSTKKHHASIASCRLLNQDGSLQPQGGALPNLLNLKAWMFFLDDIPGINRLFLPYQQRNRHYFLKNQHPGWVAGTALLIKHAVFDLLNGFDEDIFMYAEDVDLCLRAKKLGYQINYFTTPAITHLAQGGGSSKNAILGEFKGLVYLFKKQYPAWQLPLLRAILWIGAIMRSLIIRVILRNDDKAAIYRQAASLARS